MTMLFVTLLTATRLGIDRLAIHLERLGARVERGRPTGRPGPRGPADRAQAGQATAEYALVLLGVAAIALLLAAWAAKSGKIGQLFDTVVDQLIDKVK